MTCTKTHAAAAIEAPSCQSKLSIYFTDQIVIYSKAEWMHRPRLLVCVCGLYLSGGLPVFAGVEPEV